MNALAFDLRTIVIVWLAATIVLIPLLALSVRLAVVPTLEALARLRRPDPRMDAALERRLAGTEADLARLSRELERLAAARAAGVS